MTENLPPAPSPVQQAGIEYIIRFFALVPMALYMIVAALLTIIAVFSVYDAAQQIVDMIVTHDFTNGILLMNVINSLLLTITIIVLFETVTVYFRTKHVEVRALLIAGLTGMVRHILIFNVSSTNDVYMMFAAVALLAVLIAGIVLVKSEVTASPV